MKKNILIKALFFIFCLVAMAGILFDALNRHAPLSKIAVGPALVSIPLPQTENTPAKIEVPKSPKLFEYLEVVGSCGPHFEGTCVNVRSGPGTNFPVVTNLRNGVVLKIAETTTDSSGRKWHKVDFSAEWIRYPERITSDWYVADDFVRDFFDVGTQTIATSKSPETTKHIVVDLSEQKLSAYDGDALFMETPVSTGNELTPTAVGTFWIYKKMPSRFMQGPVPGTTTDIYDSPGVPWDLYFTQDGTAIHGAYWHTNFGKVWSHGCVNLPLDQARKIYDWAVLGTKVVVQD